MWAEGRQATRPIGVHTVYVYKANRRGGGPQRVRRVACERRSYLWTGKCSDGELRGYYV